MSASIILRRGIHFPFPFLEKMHVSKRCSEKISLTCWRIVVTSIFIPRRLLRRVRWNQRRIRCIRLSGFARHRIVCIIRRLIVHVVILPPTVGRIIILHSCLIALNLSTRYTYFSRLLIIWLDSLGSVNCVVLLLWSTKYTRPLCVCLISHPLGRGPSSFANSLACKSRGILGSCQVDDPVGTW